MEKVTTVGIDLAKRVFALHGWSGARGTQEDGETRAVDGSGGKPAAVPDRHGGLPLNRF